MHLINGYIHEEDKKKLRKLSKKERKKQILEQAILFFAREGYDKADLSKLAQELGIGKGTIYRHFSSKQNLFFAAVDLGMVRLKESIDQAAEKESDPLYRIQKAIEAYLTFFSKHPEFVELFIQERAYFPHREKATYFIHREQNIEKWRKLLEELIHQKIFRPLPIEETLDIMGDLLYGTIFSNFLAKREKDPQEQARLIWDLTLKGLLQK